MTDSSHWLRLNVFVADNMRPWNVKHWCTTLEACCSGLHAHVMLQFNSTVDKTAAAFLFEGVKPNIQPHDLCGEGLNRRKLQIGIDLGQPATLRGTFVLLATTRLCGPTSASATKFSGRGPRSCGSNGSWPQTRTRSTCS